MENRPIPEAGGREERLRKALSAALGMLIAYEPPDSRAVSDMFVALACVEAGPDDQACWDIIKQQDAADVTLLVERGWTEDDARSFVGEREP
jgi:hypothetical protein